MKQSPKCTDMIETTSVSHPCDLRKEKNRHRHEAQAAYCALSNACLNPFEIIVSLLTEVMEVVSRPNSYLCLRDYLTV